MSKKLTLSGIVVAVIASSSLVFAALLSQPGRFVVWGYDTAPLVIEGAPSGAFIALAAGGAEQTLAIKADRTLYVNPLPVPPSGPGPIPQPVEFDGQEFCAVGTGRSHGLAIRPTTGSIAAWPVEARGGAPTTGQFVAVTGLFSFYSAALDANGNIVLWSGLGPTAPDYAKIVGVGPPSGRFKAIAARGRYVLALAEDGTIYGWGADGRPGVPAGRDFPIFTSAANPWTPDGLGHFIAPMEGGNPYTAIAAGLDVIVAVRADGTAVQWAMDPAPGAAPLPLPPADVVFMQIAAGAGFAAGIDEAGGLRAWGTPAWVNNISPGVYSALSAATSHIAAIEAPRSFLWPPNHKMKEIVLTFRADDNCTPVPLSGLSIELRSNQPDNGSGSGNTTGDTNGEDGYSAPVVLPATAVSQNGDGSFTATFQLRAERSNALPGSRIYTVAIVSTDSATPPNTSTRMTAQILVQHGGE